MRASSRYGGSHFTIFTEANSSWTTTGDYAAMLLRNVTDITVVSGDRNKDTHRPGVITTNATKEAAAVSLQELLEEGRIMFAESVISDNTLADISELLVQLARFRRVTDASKAPEHIPARSSLSAKGPGGQQDDLAMCLQQAIVQAEIQVSLRPGVFTYA